MSRTGAHSGLHGDELNEYLRGHLKAGVACEQTSELFLFIARHQFYSVVVAREGAENVHERVAGNDGLVGVVVGT